MKNWDEKIRNAMNETERAQAVVRKVGNEWCIFSKDGKKLECKSTKKEAEERLRQIEFFASQDD